MNVPRIGPDRNAVLVECLENRLSQLLVIRVKVEDIVYDVHQAFSWKFLSNTQKLRLVYNEVSFRNSETMSFTRRVFDNNNNNNNVEI